MTALAPGARIGVFGGGQLGRMLGTAAADLGFAFSVFEPEPACPAAQVAARAICAPYDDAEALAAFAAELDVATWEFENVPVAAVRAVAAAGVPVRPGPQALEAAQDRLVEKRFLRECGFATAAFAPVDDAAGLEAAVAEIGLPAVLKTRRLGYDGKGQAWIRTPSETPDAWRAIGGRPAILEAAVPFAKEVSLVAARGLDGAFAAYDLTENVHEAGILRVSRAPAEAAPAVAAEAARLVRGLMLRLDYVGVLAVEFFLMADGRLVANEIAPRVHNSGHWTADACVTGQFEQHIRAIAGWPLGDASRLVAGAEMRNLIGADVERWDQLTQNRNAKVRLYGKREVRPGRKMGHVTLLTLK